MTHLRVGRSVLNDRAFSLSFSTLPQWSCHAPWESPGHILFNYFLYTRKRLTLMSKEQTIIPKFHKLPGKRKLDVWFASRQPRLLPTKQISANCSFTISSCNKAF